MRPFLKSGWVGARTPTGNLKRTLLADHWRKQLANNEPSGWQEEGSHESGAAVVALMHLLLEEQFMTPFLLPTLPFVPLVYFNLLASWPAVYALCTQPIRGVLPPLTRLPRERTASISCRPFTFSMARPCPFSQPAVCGASRALLSY